MPGATVNRMQKPDRDSLDPRAVKLLRRSQVEALLFAGATLATTALTLGTLCEPKLPPFRGQ